MLTATTRAVLVVFGMLLAIGGLLAASVGGGIGALWVTVTGMFFVVVALIERQRYRSEATDQPFEPTGPGGGEPTGTLEPRFRPTEELFVDPTTKHTMRVHVDPRTGERRYVAER
jgi:hypothetical protein